MCINQHTEIVQMVLNPEHCQNNANYDGLDEQ